MIEKKPTGLLWRRHPVGSWELTGVSYTSCPTLSSRPSRNLRGSSRHETRHEATKVVAPADVRSGLRVRADVIPGKTEARRERKRQIPPTERRTHQRRDGGAKGQRGGRPGLNPPPGRPTVTGHRQRGRNELPLYRLGRQGFSGQRAGSRSRERHTSRSTNHGAIARSVPPHWVVQRGRRHTPRPGKPDPFATPATRVMMNGNARGVGWIANQGCALVVRLRGVSLGQVSCSGVPCGLVR